MTRHPVHQARRTLLSVCIIALAAIAAACGSDTVDSKPGAAASKSGPKISFTSPTDGATVTSPVAVTMTASNFTIEPAGDVHAGAGHFHVMVDVGCVAPGTAVPKDDSHVHLGKAQLSTEIVLAPGPHKLCLQAGDGAHVALAITDEISITVSG
jgi:uncharacterized protein DUF4399